LSNADTSPQKLGRDTLIYGVAFVASRAASFVMLPIYTRYLTPADYAVLHLLQMTLDVVSIMLAAGVTAGVHRFYFKAKTQAERNAVMTASFWMLLLFNLAGAAIMYALSERVAALVLETPNRGPLVLITAANFTLEALLTVPMLLLQVQQRSVAYCIWSLARLGLQLTLHILFVVVLEVGVRGILASTLITYVVLGTGLSVWFFRSVGFFSQRAVAWALFKFGLPYRITEVGTFLMAYAARVFLQQERGLTETGVYSLAYQFGFLLMYLGPAPFHLAWDPQRFELVKRPRAERDAAYNEGLLYFNVLLITLSVGICVYVSPVLTLMSDTAYHGAALLVPVIISAFLFQAWGHVVEFGVQVSERTVYTTIGTWIAVLVIMALYVVLIPTYGVWGAAWATVVGFGTRWLCLAVFARRLFPVTYRVGRSIRLTFLGVATVAAYYLVAPVGLLNELLMATALCLAYFAALWWIILQVSERARIVDWTQARLAALRSAL